MAVLKTGHSVMSNKKQGQTEVKRNRKNEGGWQTDWQQ